MPLVYGIHHATLLVGNLVNSLLFYQGVLGLEVNAQRPDLGFPGVWMEVGEQQIHLMELPNPDPLQGRPAHGGRDRHVALVVESLKESTASLDSAGISYTRSRSGRNALFCRDPDGNALEFVERRQI